MELPMDTTCFLPAYNAPANILLQDCPWGFDIWAAFTYWHISQEGMEAARRLPTVNVNGGLLTPDFDWEPGFKVGIGFNTDYDDWTAALEYTWVRSKTSSTSFANADNPYFSNNWSIPARPDSLVINDATSVSTSWRLHLDRLDLTFARPYYQGKRLTVTPFGGLRGQWIRQRYSVDLAGGEFDADVTARSHSWAVGPVVGANTHWLMGCGFRLEGVANGSILYTRYKHVRQSETFGGTTGSSNGHNVGFLRPSSELGVGLGWGSYLGCKNYYLDFSARYDFNVLWDQNVMVSFVNAMNGVPGTSGNLYMHGLTLTALFAF